MDLNVNVRNADVVTIKIPFNRELRSSLHRDNFKSGVILTLEGGGHLGFGEAPTLALPSYGPDFTNGAFVAVELFLEMAKGYYESNSKEITIPVGDFIGRLLQSYRGNRPAIAAIEMALLDLYARQNSIGPLETIAQYLNHGEVEYGVGAGALVDRSGDLLDFELEPQGGSLGLLPLSGLDGAEADDSYDYSQYLALIESGFRRIKVKVDGSKGGSILGSLAKVCELNQGFVELSVDANCSLRQPFLLESIYDIGFSYVEDPYEFDSLSNLADSLSNKSGRVALDGCLTSLPVVSDYIKLVNFDIGVLKLDRMGSILEVVRSANALALAGKNFYIGGMYDSPILRRLNGNLIRVLRPTEASDLGADGDYFDCELLPSALRMDDGRLTLPGGVGLCGIFLPNEDQIGISTSLLFV